MSKFNSKCLNSFNEFYLKELTKLANDAKEKNNRNLHLIYKKVSLSIQKYPFPILSASQATLLEGVGDTISKQFEKLLNEYREKIEQEKINYIEQAYCINLNFNNTKKTLGGKRKAQTDTESDSKNRSNLKKRKRLTNIEPFSSVWSSVVSAYILYLQNNSVIIDSEDILAMSRTITEELKNVKNIQTSEGIKDFKYMKSLNLLENVELKDKKIKINDFLIKLAKIELKKCGMVVENDGSGALNFFMVEPEKKEENLFLDRINEDIYINNNVLSQQLDKNNISRSHSVSSKKSNSLNNSTLDSFVKNSKNPFSEESTYKEDDGNFRASNSFLREKYDSYNDKNVPSFTSNISNNLSSKNNKSASQNISYNITNYFPKNSSSVKENSLNKNNFKEPEKLAHLGVQQTHSQAQKFPDKNISRPITTSTTNIATSNSLSYTKFKKFKQCQSSIPRENIILLVDNREKGPNAENIVEEILKINPEIIVKERTLSLGDFMWVYIDPETELEFVLDFIIERKTTEDLAKSILDGRYNEQKYRLKNCGIKNIFYLFEAGSSQSVVRGNFSKQSLTTAIFNTLNIHDVNVIRSYSLEESLNAILKLDNKIRFQGDYFSAKIESDTKFDKRILYSEFTQSNAKTKNSTIENIFVRQLRCFDDCGAKSVEILRRVFKSPRYIWEILKQIDEDETKENLITVASYLVENKISLTSENLIYYARAENFKNIKKDVKSVKKIRKNTNYSIISFYSS